MKLAFTLCSNNYLAQAKTLADSLIDHNPEYTVIIGLVDERSDLIDYDFFLPHQIIPIADIGINDFESLWKKYNIIELNTSVKPSFFKYLWDRFPEAEFLIYFDPDIMIFHSLQELEQEFTAADILLTPHVFKPIPVDNLRPSENTFLNYGIYNLGFAGIKPTEGARQLLDWWEERTLTRGYIDESNGIFVDQLWMNHAPLFFEKVKVLTSFGYNMAPWNLQERKHIKKEKSSYKLEDGNFLVFYHFSTYNYRQPEMLSRYNRNTFENTPDVKELYETYHTLLLQNKVGTFSTISCGYVEKRKAYLQQVQSSAMSEPRIISSVKKFGKFFLPGVILIFVRKLLESK
jgi:hypothetical protein